MPEGLMGAPVKAPFEAIVSRHGATVLRVCRAVVAPSDADDAWSETFLSALQTYPDLPADANIEAWLVTIAHRKAIDVTRAAARRATPVADVTDLADADANGSSDREPRTGDLPTGDDLWPALAALPDKQRAAVAYHYLGGQPYREVAAVLGGTADAARRAAADGIAALRRTYRGTHQEGKTR